MMARCRFVLCLALILSPKSAYSRVLLRGKHGKMFDVDEGPYQVGLRQQNVFPVDKERFGSFPYGYNGYLPFDMYYPVEQDAVTEDAVYTIPYYDSSSNETYYLGLPWEGVAQNVAAAKGLFPLVVYSHGGGGSTFSDVGLFKKLASFGFIVAVPLHAGNSNQENPDGSTPYGQPPFDGYCQAACNRPKDISALMDWLLLEDQSDVALAINQDQIGVIGQSLGGTAAMSLASGFGDVLNGAPDNGTKCDYGPNSRIKAAVALAPALTSPNAPDPGNLFSPQEFEAIDIPFLLMGGQLDNITLVSMNLDPYMDALFPCPSEDRMRIDVINATHTSFVDIPFLSDSLQAFIDVNNVTELYSIAMGLQYSLIPAYEACCSSDYIHIEDAQDIVGFYAVAFFKTHLVGEKKYKKFLGLRGVKHLPENLSAYIDMENSVFPSKEGKKDCGKEKSGKKGKKSGKKGI